MKKLLLLFALPLLCLAQGSNKGGNIVFPGAPAGACTSPQIAVNAATGDQYNCLNSVWNLVTGGGGGGVSSLAATSPTTTSGSTGAITIGCATCATAAGTLTSTALVTGGGGKSTQTPAATATLDSSGNLAGVILTNPGMTPLYSTAKTGISMTAGTGVNTGVTGGECTSGVCTMTTPAADGTYLLYYTIYETTVGSGGTCTTGAARLDISYKPASGATAYANAARTLITASGGSFVSVATMTNAGPGSVNDYSSSPVMFLAKSGTAITYAIEQTAASNCSTPPVFTVRPILYGPLF